MSDPLFDSVSARFALPFLFAGQAQKEGHVNESLARIDAALHPAIEGELAAPPASPGEGQSWLVGASPGGAWTGHAGQLASYAGGNWLFIAPRDGLRVLNRATGQDIRFHSTWKVANRPAAPSGGSTIDSEARAALTALIAALTTAGILSTT